MKIKGFIITGILLTLIGAGICTIATTRDDFDIKNAYVDPTIEEKRIEFDSIEKITYEGKADYVIFKQSEETNSLTYYEGKYVSYSLDYNEGTKELIIKQKYKSGFFNVSAITKGNKPIVLTLKDSIDSINVDMNAGKLTTENLNIKQATLEINAGDMEFRNTKIDVLNAEINAGDLRFYGDILTNATISINAGYLKMELDASKDTYKINGKGIGEVLIFWTIHAGSSSFTYKE